MYGIIVSDWKLAEGRFRWKVTIPANSTATVYVPAKIAADVTVNGLSIKKAEHVIFLKIERNRAVINIGAGIYEFLSRQRQERQNKELKATDTSAP
jgi:alpha-L-rhamnosidase